MAKKVLLDAQLTLNAVNVTQWVSKIEFEDTIEDKETTTYASGKAKERQGGLEDHSLAITFKNDFDAAAIDAIMWPLRRQVVAWTARADAAAVSVNNPQYSGSVLINGWTPISGTVGDVAEVDVTFPGSSPVVRATS